MSSNSYNFGKVYIHILAISPENASNNIRNSGEFLTVGKCHQFLNRLYLWGMKSEW